MHVHAFWGKGGAGGIVERRKLQRPGSAKEGRNTTKHRTVTSNPNNRHCSQIKHRDPLQINPRVKSHNTRQHRNPERSSSAPGQHYTDPADSSQSTQTSACRRRRVGCKAAACMIIYVSAEICKTCDLAVHRWVPVLDGTHLLLPTMKFMLRC